MNMLYKAREHFLDAGLKNICLLRAEVAHLPLKDAVADLVLSMNGWHAFADKQRAIAEIRRVLRKHRTLIACGYVKGARKISDWFVKHFGVRNDYFVPPFFEPRDLASRFGGFKIIRRGHIKSIAYFEAISEERQRGQPEQ